MSLVHRQAAQAAASRSACPAVPSKHAPCKQPLPSRQPVTCGAAGSALATELVTTSSTWITKEARHAMFQAVALNKVEPVQAQVKGTIPAWLEGDLLANGSGSYAGMNHMFDGLAMLTKLSIKQGSVSASQRYVESEQFDHYKRTGKLKWREFFTELKFDNPVERTLALAENLMALATNGPATTDNPSVNLVPLPDGTLLAMSEPLFAQFKVSKDLATLDKVNFQADGVGGQVTTAHPKLMGDGKTLVNITHSLPAGGIHVILQDLDTLKRREIAYIKDVGAAKPNWIHDISISENYAIVIESPLSFDMGKLILGGTTDYLFMNWTPEDGTRVHVIALDGSGHVTHTAPAFFNMHHINAYEEGDNIHVHFSGYRDPEILNDLRLANCSVYPGKNVSKSYLWGLTMPKSTKQSVRLPYPHDIVPQPELYGEFCEFPTVSPDARRKPYRYTYSLAATRPTHLGNTLAKCDLVTGAVKLWHEPGCAPGEPTFVPAPNAKSEDEGVVMVTVTGPDGNSFLLFLDGQSFTEVARAEVPFGMPYRFHGVFCPTNSN